MQLPRLVEWRRRRALALRDLAAQSGVAPATISRIERGLQVARPSTTRKLAKALDVDPSALMEPSGERSDPTQPVTEEHEP